MKVFLFKTIAAASFTALAAYFGELLLPLLILFACLVADYVSGLIKAYVGASLSSKIGITGILKKLCYLLCVCVGVGVDLLLSSVYGTEGTVACLVTVWLTVNELISILENLSAIGVPLPGFLISITNRLLQNSQKED